MSTVPARPDLSIVGSAVAYAYKKKQHRNAVKAKKRTRNKRRQLERTGGRVRPQKLSRQKDQANLPKMSRGRSGRAGGYFNRGSSDSEDGRIYAMRVLITPVGESPSEAINSACDCCDYFSEIHVVLPGSHKRGRAQKALKELYGPSKEDQEDYKADMKLMKDRSVELVIHTRYFDSRRLFHHINRLVDVTGLTSFTADHMDEWLVSRVDVNFKRRGYKRMRYSMKSVVDEANYSLWTPLIVSLMIFNWWRSLFSSFNRTIEGVDMVMLPVHHDDEGPYIPEERRFLGCIPTTGWPIDRDRRLAVPDGPRIIIPLHWTGYQRFMWLCQRQDMWGIMSLFGWTTFMWLLSIPYWNFLIPWLRVEWDAALRLTFFSVHTILMVFLLPTVYHGELQNISIVFATPVFIMVLPLFILYGTLFYRGEKSRRRQERALPKVEDSPRKNAPKRRNGRREKPSNGEVEKSTMEIEDDQSRDDSEGSSDSTDDERGATIASEDLDGAEE